MRRISGALRTARHTLRRYWPLIKSLQTSLLLTTGIAGYLSAAGPSGNWGMLVGMAGSLFLTISGSTVLNMWYDRDIDAKMKRTCYRPLPIGVITPAEATWLGIVLSIAGVTWAALVDPLFAVIVFSGLFFDVVVYTIWLKRRTCWAIIFGGISGGMPILAGRALSVGGIDWIGIAMAAGVLFWIPTHIMTFSMRHHEDYMTAGIPTFPSTYGFHTTRVIIAVSSILAALTIAAAAIGIGLDWGYIRLLGVLSAGMLCLAIVSVARPSEKINFGLFKYASLYMLSTMILLII